MRSANFDGSGSSADLAALQPMFERSASIFPGCLKLVFFEKKNFAKFTEKYRT